MRRPTGAAGAQLARHAEPTRQGLPKVWADICSQSATSGGCAPARPACAAARARTPTLPVPRATSGHPLPHSITTHSLCVPGIVQVSTRAFKRGAVRLRSIGACFLLRKTFKKPKFSSGAPPRTP